MSDSNPVASEAVRLAPPAAAVTSHYVLGLSLPDWVQMLTIIYTILMISGWIWDRFVIPRMRAREAEAFATSYPKADSVREPSAPSPEAAHED